MPAVRSQVKQHTVDNSVGASAPRTTNNPPRTTHKGPFRGRLELPTLRLHGLAPTRLRSPGRPPHNRCYRVRPGQLSHEFVVLLGLEGTPAVRSQVKQHTVDNSVGAAAPSHNQQSTTNH